MCFDTKRASFCLPQSTPPQSSLQVARAGATEREEKFSLSVSCFIITLCRMERRFITIPVFGGCDKDEQRDEEEEKVWETLKVLVSLSGRTLGGHGYE